MLCVCVFMILPVYTSTQGAQTLIFGSALLDCLVDLLVIIYLLFGGKTIYKIIDRTSQLNSEGLLQRENYAEILVRFCGIWWLWKIVQCIFSILQGFILIVALKLCVSIVSAENIPKFEQLLEISKKAFSWSSLVSILEYSILAWYFLKKGKLIIKLFSIRWLGKKILTSTSAQ